MSVFGVPTETAYNLIFSTITLRYILFYTFKDICLRHRVEIMCVFLHMNNGERHTMDNGTGIGEASALSFH